MSDMDTMGKLSDAVRAGAQVEFDGERLTSARVKLNLNSITLTHAEGAVTGLLVQLHGEHIAHFLLTREQREKLAAALLAEAAA